MIEIGQTYRHHRNKKDYKVVLIVKSWNSETEEGTFCYYGYMPLLTACYIPYNSMVAIYQSLDDGEYYARTTDNFLELIPRFTRMDGNG